MTKQTKGQEVASDIAALLRARNSLLWVVTREEARVEGYLFEAAASAGYEAMTWDVAAGACDINGRGITGEGGTQDAGSMLSVIENVAKGERSRKVRTAWIMRDLPIWLSGGLVGASPLRQVRNLARFLPTVPRDLAQAIIVLTPSADVPPELANHATVIEWPLPDREEIADILDAAIEGLPDDLRKQAAPNGQRDAAIDAAVGLSGEEASNCYARSLVQLKRIDPALVAQEKKRVIAREKVLEWYDPLPGGLDAVGGLENLKSWLVSRSTAYSPEARAYGLPAPKGTMVVGVSGTGKSLTAKALATGWRVPLLKLDLNALKGKFVGESEGNLRRALKVIDAVGRCVLWLDEIEKALQGATSGSSDGGVSVDALGTILTWMQERRGEAFVIATANDVSALPPELLRKGRFDEIWWVDLPTQNERMAILAATLRQHGKGETVKLDMVADACETFTGAEIAAIVPEAMFAAFADNGRDITTTDLITAATTVVPLAKTAEEKIAKLREWAQGRARPASVPQREKATGGKGRKLDI